MKNRTPKTSRRSFIRSATAAAAGAMAFPYYIRPSLAQSDNLLIVNTWGGAFTQAERKAIFDPFTKETGIKVETDTPVSFAKLKSQVETKNYIYDVSSLNSMTMAQARNAGLVEPLDWDVIDRRGTKNIFFGDYGVGANYLSTALAYRTDHFPNGGPQNWQDFFDIKKFPGKRSMGKRSYTTLSFAALGAGVPKEKLFPLNLDQAFAALDRIRPTVRTWWEGGNESEQLLRDGEVSMMSIWNQRPQNLIQQKVPVKIVWEGAEHVPGLYYMAKGAPHKRAAMKFLNFICRPDIQAAFSAENFYSPTNPDALALMTPAMQDLMSTKPEYLKVGYAPDAEWVGENLANIERRFITWLAAG